jgi:hypothetical protein
MAVSCLYWIEYQTGENTVALKLIGAGLGRTGTASTKVALELLGLGNCYHMTEVMHEPSRIQDWIDAADGKPDWDATFDGYGATVDYPGGTFWRELADYYPDAKVLLTVRDPNKWFESTSQTILSPAFCEFLKESPFGELMEKVIWSTLDHKMQDRDHMVAHFEKHMVDVIAALPAERLLVWSVKEGWEPLCEFLELPVPDEKFPRINSRDETKELLETLVASSGKEISEEAMSAAAQSLHGK